MAEVILTINGRKIHNTFTSLRKETRALERELLKLTPGTDAFINKAQEVRNARAAFNIVNKEVVSIRKEIDKTGNFITRFIDRLGGIEDVFAGMLTGGTFFTAKGTVDELLKIADAITDVQKTSGLSKKSVGELWHELSDLDTRTTKLNLMKIAEIGGRLGIQDKSELKNFTKEIDKAYVALGDSFSGGLEAVTNKLGKMKSLFAETKDLDYGTAINKIGSALNELAAQGTASEENISDFALRVGQLPEALKPASDRVIGLGAAFEESGLTAEIAASGYSRFMISAADNIEAFAKSMGMGLDEAKKLLNEKPDEFFIRFAQGMKGLDATTTAKIFKKLKLNTQEITKAVGAAAQNSGRFYDMMRLSGKAMEDATSLTNEFNNKNTNSAAIWEKIFKTIKNVVTDGAIPDFFDSVSEFFGKITGITSESGNGVQVFTKRLLFLIKTLTIAATAFVSYRAAIWLTSKATKNIIRQTILYNTVEKLAILRKKIATGATLLYAAAKYKLSGNTKRATAAMRMFNTVTKLNPIGLLIGVFTSAYIAMQMFSKETEKASVQTKALADAEKEAAVHNAKTKHNLEQLLKVAKDETKTKKERQEAIDELNKIVPDYNNGLTIESAKTQDATNKLDKYIERLKATAKQKYLNALINKKAEKIAAIETSSLEDHIKWYEKLAHAIHAAVSEDKYAVLNAKVAANKRKLLLKEENEELKKLQELLDKQKEKNKPKEGDLKEVNGITFVFRNGKWQRLRLNKNTDDTGKGDKFKEEKKALEMEAKTNQKFLELERKLEDEKFKVQEESKEKQLSLLDIEYKRKIEKIRAENANIIKEISQTNEKMSQLRKQKAVSKSPKQKEDINKALKTYDAIQKKRVDIQKKNTAIIEQLDKTRLYKKATLKEKWFVKEIERERKKIEKNKELAIDKINTIKTFEEAKRTLQELYGVKDISKLRNIIEAKNKLRKEANKKALKEQVKFLEKQSATLKEELKNITGAGAEELKKNIQFLEEKLTKVKGILQGEQDGETKTTDLGQAGGVDILGFTTQEWVDVFDNLDTIERKIRAVEMVMQALGNAGHIFAERQRIANEIELRNFTNYQEKRKSSLKNQLDNGLISKEKFHKESEKLEIEAANKKAELEYKQAKTEKILRLFSAIGDTSVAVAKALTAGPIIGPILATIIGGLGAVQIDAIIGQPLPSKATYAEGGFTSGLGFKDETGHEVAGVAHAGEYYIPNWLLQDPVVANVAQWIEAKRTGSTTSFHKGGYTSENEVVKDENNEIEAANSDSDIMLVYAINRLNENLEKLEREGLEAFLLADAKSGKLMHQAIKQYQRINNKNRR